MTQPSLPILIPYQEGARLGAAAGRPRRLVLVFTGPFIWGLAGLILVGPCIVLFLRGFFIGSEPFEFASPIVAVIIPWVLLSAILVMAVIIARTLRSLRRARGQLVLSWIDTAVGLNLPLHAFLQSAAGSERGKTRRRLQALAMRLSSGFTLGEALLRDVPEIPDTVALAILAAEHIGQLAPTLHRVVKQESLDRRQKTRPLIFLGGMYPGIILLFACSTILDFLIYVLPKFREIMKDFKLPLPAIDLFFEWLADFVFNDYWFIGTGLLLLLALALIIVVGRRVREIFAPNWPRLTPAFVLDRVRWLTPFRRPFIRTTSLAAVCRFLADALRAGMPLPDAVGAASSLVTNSAFRTRIVRWRNALLAGQTPADAARSAGLPSLLVGFLDTASSRGSVLPDALLFLSRYYRGRHARLRVLLATVVEPVCVLLLAALVFAIALCVFLPILSILNESMQFSGSPL